MSKTIVRPTLSLGNHIYLYRLLRDAIGCGKQTFMTQIEEALAAGDMTAYDLGFESTRELLEELDDCIKLTVFKGGRLYATVIANVAGHCDDDYAEVVSKLDDSPADMLEINVSCPNVSAGGMSVGTDPVALSRLITRLRKLTDKKMIVKLTPNVTDITVPARAAVESGADALSLINTLLGMRINIRTGEPVITGGVSGPAVLPVGLAAVWRVRAALPEIPIIGIGGIDSGETALEYLYAGANAVEVGAAALFEPTAPLRVARELDDLLDERPELADKLAKGETWR